MALLERTTEQRADALEKASIARTRRAAALDKVRDGSMSLAEVLNSPEPAVQKAKVRTVLLALPGVGDVAAGKAMEEIDIDPKRRVQGLGDRQRAALLERFPG